MRKETPEANKPLRSGYTTGACATATSYAAARLLLTGKPTTASTITLPKGQHVEFQITNCLLRDNNVGFASTIKDAGDDPDVTHGATVFAEVSLNKQPGVYFHAAKGVGTVTRDGLALAKGEPAINPVPRKMMTFHLNQLATEQNYSGGFDVFIGVEGGEDLALKTMNPRLGILGGLSILGTTGIVRPFSCAAYIASIHQGIDVAYTNDVQHIAACTGSTSEAFAIKQYPDIPEMGLIEMADFAGAVLKHVKHSPVAKLSIVGGFGKLTKLAAGHLDLHSRASSIDFQFLAEQAKHVGAEDNLIASILNSNTSLEALKLCQQANIPFANRICELARNKAKSILPETTQVEVWAISKKGDMVGHANWAFGSKPKAADSKPRANIKSQPRQ